MAKIQMPDNQSFELDDEMAKDDATLRAALKAAYPDAANATFERSGGKDGKPLVVKVVKKAGTKGSGIIPDLLAAPAYENEAVAMARRLHEMSGRKTLTWERALGMSEEITAAAEAGAASLDSIATSREVLTQADAQTSMILPVGF